MLTRTIRIQLIVFSVLTVFALGILCWYYVRLPSLVGVGQYHLYAELPRSGGLYATSNVTYRGATIGTVVAVEPIERGVRVTMRIESRHRVPVDATANVHSVSALGEQYLDLVSTRDSGKYLADGQTITKGTVPSEIGPLLDATNRSLAALPADRIATLLNETSQAVGGLGPALRRLIDSTTNIAAGFDDNLGSVTDIINNSTPILDSQVSSGAAVQRWAANVNTLASQAAQQDPALRNALTQAAPTLDAVNASFSDVRDALPQTLANLEVILDMLKRYHNNVEQAMVVLPQFASIAEAGTSPFPGEALLDLGLDINLPPPCLTGFLPPSQWRSPADTSTAPAQSGLYCKIPQDYQGNSVRGSRNFPCADVPGRRAATPKECRSDQPYTPLGTNPWFGDPNQILTCPAPAARCDQPVKPGLVIPGQTVNNGINPLPASQLPPREPNGPVSDPLSRPRGGSVVCTGQQPNQCTFTARADNTAVYNPSSSEVEGPDGVRYHVDVSTHLGDNGWQQMLAPPAQ